MECATYSMAWLVYSVTCVPHYIEYAVYCLECAAFYMECAACYAECPAYYMECACLSVARLFTLDDADDICNEPIHEWVTGALII